MAVKGGGSRAPSLFSNLSLDLNGGHRLLIERFDEHCPHPTVPTAVAGPAHRGIDPDDIIP